VNTPYGPNAYWQIDSARLLAYTVGSGNTLQIIQTDMETMRQTVRAQSPSVSILSGAALFVAKDGSLRVLTSNLIVAP
jgi:hypothetical protein